MVGRAKVKEEVARRKVAVKAIMLNVILDVEPRAIGVVA